MKTNYLGADAHCKMTGLAVERDAKIVVWETKDNWPRPARAEKQPFWGWSVRGSVRFWLAGWAGPKDLTTEKAS